VKLFGPLPSFQENLSALDALQRQLMCSALSSDPPCEKRYPYLDRGLLEFLYAVPREQLVRPGQRRSLMRRALVGIVPDDLLNRKRKAFVVRAPIAAISREWPRLMEIATAMVSASIGIVDPQRLVDALEKVRHGKDASTIPLMRAFGVESWLQHLGSQKLLDVTVPSARKDPTAVMSDVKCTTQPG
jgi:asparagine synthase